MAKGSWPSARDFGFHESYRPSEDADAAKDAIAGPMVGQKILERASKINRNLTPAGTRTLRPSP